MRRILRYMRKRSPLSGTFFRRHAFGGLSHSVGSYYSGAGGVLPAMPVVTQSRVLSNQPDGIQVHFDRPMMATGDVTSQISVIINGGVPITPTSIAFHPSNPAVMGIVLPVTLISSDHLTWAYTTGAQKIQEVASPNAEMDIQTFSVHNDISHNDWSNDWSNDFGG